MYKLYKVYTIYNVSEWGWNVTYFSIVVEIYGKKWYDYKNQKQKLEDQAWPEKKK